MNYENKKGKIGVWFIGAFGSVAASAIAGAKAVAGKLCATTGLVTEHNLLNNIEFIEFDDIEFGGMDIRKGSIFSTLSDLHERANVIPHRVIESLKQDLLKVDENIRPGITLNCGEAIDNIADGDNLDNQNSLKELIEIIKNEINRFKEKNGLEYVIVINCASTEQYMEFDEKNSTLEGIRKAIFENLKELYPASVIYAWAAIDAGCPYINFTPSIGASLKGLKELAIERKVPIAGNDGKTGETLIKSVLAPMFVCRNLEVLSWEGYNILGNSDGLILADPKNKETKIRSKSRSLNKILGYQPHSSVHIDMVPSLNDWKIAWDFIHFKGFMETPMIMQVLWQGCDSILAAPLILDLIRLIDLSVKSGEFGVQNQLSCFFKDPLDCAEYDLHSQFETLMVYINSKRRC